MVYLYKYNNGVFNFQESQQTPFLVGTYFFSGLDNGTYRVRVESADVPADYVPTYDYDGIGSAHQATFSVNSQAIENVNFGYQEDTSGGGGGSRPSSISGRTWEDHDGDGHIDEGIRYVKLDLYKLENEVYVYQSRVVATLQGDYSFTALDPGTYKVKVFSDLGSWYPIWDYDDPVRSYLGIDTPEEAVLSIASGTDVIGVDFGYQRFGEIQGRWWEDTNGNGVEDSGEPGLDDLTVYLENLIDGEYTLYETYVTNSHGLILLDDVHAGQFRIRADAAGVDGYTATSDPDGIGTPNLAEFFLEPGERELQIDFGFQPDVPTAGMIGYWPLDEGGGSTAYDATPQGYDGTLTGDTAWTSGALGQSLTFDGSGDSLEFMTTPAARKPRQGLHFRLGSP